MWSVLVVGVGVAAHEAFDLTLVPDDGSVEKLAADRSDPSLSERVRDRDPHWCLQDLETFGSDRTSAGRSRLGWWEGVRG